MQLGLKALSEEHGKRAFYISSLRRIFGLTSVEAEGGWRELNNM
jgi:hypothetical protein